MDRAEASRIAHGDLLLYNPLSTAALDEAIELLELRHGARVLDVACGRAEVLSRVAQLYDVEAIGYDADAELVAAAPAGLDVRVAESPPEGPFDLVICIASSHAVGGFPDALAALRALLAPGGQLLLGEGYWRRPPSEGYLDALGGATADELSDYTGLMAAAEDAGLTPLYASVASDADWDRYEWTQILNSERSGHPALHERATRARARLAMPGGRETLGFALVLMRRDANQFESHHV